MKLYKFAFVPFAFLAVACGSDGSSVSIVGKTPVEQANSVADARCDYVASCGDVSLEQGFDQETQMITCVATIEDKDYQACFDDEQPDELSTFENCEGLSAEDEQTIQDCFNAILDRPCLTQGELDTYCDGVIAGEEPEFPGGEIPAVCNDAFGILEACDTPA